MKYSSSFLPIDDDNISLKIVCSEAKSCKNILINTRLKVSKIGVKFKILSNLKYLFNHYLLEILTWMLYTRDIQ